MEPMRWNNADPNPGARPQTSVFRGDKGLDVANQNRASGGGRKMFLTSPYIDQAIALIEGFECYGDFTPAMTPRVRVRSSRAPELPPLRTLPSHRTPNSHHAEAYESVPSSP